MQRQHCNLQPTKKHAEEDCLNATEFFTLSNGKSVLYFTKNLRKYPSHVPPNKDTLEPQLSDLQLSAFKDHLNFFPPH